PGRRHGHGAASPGRTPLHRRGAQLTTAPRGLTPEGVCTPAFERANHAQPHGREHSATTEERAGSARARSREAAYLPRTDAKASVLISRRMREEGQDNLVGAPVFLVPRLV